MKASLDCIPCLFSQALRAARAATDDEEKQRQVLAELGTMLPHLSWNSSPPETGKLVYGMVKRITGNIDPYQEQKRESTRQALRLYPSLQKTIQQSADPLWAAITIAAAGNVIDLGFRPTYDIRAAVEDARREDFAICDYPLFKAALRRAGKVLYIGDNAGETVFDRLLIEQLEVPVTYVVRETPVINDATIEDAVQAGLDKVAAVVSSGCEAPGIVLRFCSQEFKQLLQGTALVLAKGQGSYEGLSEEGLSAFFLLKAKCDVIAQHLGIATGAFVLKGVNIEPAAEG
jgi:uncharacterized protein with ATP-grasp and redox domains